MNTTEKYNAVRASVEEALVDFVGQTLTTDLEDDIKASLLTVVEEFFPIDPAKITVNIDGPKITADIEVDVVTIRVYGPEIKAKR